MNAKQTIDAMGGRKRVQEITGLSKGRLSQWVKENRIPVSWLTAFRAMNPQIPAELSPADVEPREAA